MYKEDTVFQVLAVYEPLALLIPKYRVGGGPLYSRVIASRLERLVWHYRPGEIARLGMVHEPCFDARVSMLQSDSPVLACDPVCRRRELLSPRDELEVIAGELIEELSLYGLDAYPTGSLLGYYHDPQLSDIDLVVYLGESLDCLDALSVLSQVLKPLESARLEKWARARGVKPWLYRVWLRGVYESRSVSVVYAASRPRRYCSLVVRYERPTRLTSMRLRIEPGRCEALIWPHIGISEDGSHAILSYDGVYSPLLLEGGCLEARGLEARIEYCGVEMRGVVVGVSEASTSLEPC